MKFELEHLGVKYRGDLDAATSLAIGLDFDGPQPNHFGTAPASRQPLQFGDFVGNTQQGGCCNVDVIELIPHCNGTHTESAGHIVDDDVFVGSMASQAWYPAIVLTMQPVPARETKETYRPEFEPDDQVIGSQMLKQAFQQYASLRPSALIIRTLPNDGSKSSRVYDEQSKPPFFSIEAMQFINQMEIQHLLVDMPSVDRMYDDGLLTCHHVYWNVPEGTHRVTDDSWKDKTISEMIFVPDRIEDGFYLLNLQVPAFFTDAAPSRPILFPCQPV